MFIAAGVLISSCPRVAGANRRLDNPLRSLPPRSAERSFAELAGNVAGVVAVRVLLADASVLGVDDEFGILLVG
jgi:hypothetical protein